MCMPDFLIMYYLLYFGHYTGDIIPSEFRSMLKKRIYKYGNWPQVIFITKKNEKLFGLERKCLEFKRHGHLHLYYFLT